MSIGKVGASSTTPTHVCASLKLFVNDATIVMRAAPTRANGTNNRNAITPTRGPKFGVIPSSSSGMNFSVK